MWRGDLLAATRPTVGVGIDLSDKMIQQAQRRHPKLRFVCGDGLEFALEEKFDFIILSDLVNDLWDVQQTFQRSPRSARRRRASLSTSTAGCGNGRWRWHGKLGVAIQLLRQNWLTADDVANLLYLAGFEVMRTWPEVLWPLRTPIIDAFSTRSGQALAVEMGGVDEFRARASAGDSAAARLRGCRSSSRAQRGREHREHLPANARKWAAGTELIFVEGGSQG